MLEQIGCKDELLSGEHLYAFVYIGHYDVIMYV